MKTAEEMVKEMAEERAKAAEERAKMEEKLAKMEEKLAKMEEERLEMAEERAKMEEERAKSEGKFYSRIDDLFISESIDELKVHNTIEHQDMKSLYKDCCRRPIKTGKRKTEDAFECRAKNGTNDVYKITREAAECSEYGDASICEDASSKSRTTNHTDSKTTIWPKMVFGDRTLTPDNVAHLVPVSNKNAESCWFVAEFLFGYLDVDINDDGQWKKIKRLLHGSKQTNDRKVDNTGIKHMVTNKVVLSQPNTYFDKEPCVIIVPILRRSEAVNWKGGGYDAIALIDTFPASNNRIFENTRDFIDVVCQQSRFVNGTDVQAKEDEVKKAHGLLCEYTRAIAYAQKKRKPTQCEYVVEDWEKLFSPKIPDNVKLLKVRKISFDNNNGREGHPAPDPLLLVTKAIANLQKRHDFKIVAAAEPEDDYLPSEQSIQAEEEYLRERQQNMMFRNPIGFDIIVNAH